MPFCSRPSTRPASSISLENGTASSTGCASASFPICKHADRRGWNTFRYKRETMTTPSTPQTDTPIKIALLAMGGQGGGVLANWLVDMAEHADRKRVG